MAPNVNFCIAYVLMDMLCAVLNFIVSSNVSRDSGSETQVRTFFLLLTSNLVFVTFDAIWAILVFGIGGQPNSVLLGVVNGVNLVAIAFTGYFWFCFSLAYFKSRMASDTRLRAAAATPVLVVVVCHVIGAITNQNVIFLPDGSVSYGVMHLIALAVPLLYLLGATAAALQHRVVATTQAARRMCLVFITFMIPPAAAGVFDAFIPDMPVAAAGIIISIVFVMMAMQESRISNDALTGLNNRRRADSFLEDMILRSSEDQPLFLFIIDMDRFKTINDTYGHLEGDHALQIMADALRSVCGKLNAFVARWGGDEFVLIGSDEQMRQPERVTRLIQDTLRDTARNAHISYNLACTVGYAKCAESSEKCTELVADADRMLYANKRISHHAA